MVCASAASPPRHPTLELVLRLGFAVIGVVNLLRAVAFWTAALNLVASEEWRSDDWVTLYHADGSGRALGLQRSQSPVEAHPRIHLDLFVDTTAEQEAEVERLVGLGARKLDWGLYPPEPDFIVLGDPDGNPFCIVDLSRAPSGDHG
ncbi:MAG: VOC family protein [Pseudonocardiaceae bacterium]